MAYTILLSPWNSPFFPRLVSLICWSDVYVIDTAHSIVYSGSLSSVLNSSSKPSSIVISFWNLTACMKDLPSLSSNHLKLPTLHSLNCASLKNPIIVLNYLTVFIEPNISSELPIAFGMWRFDFSPISISGKPSPSLLSELTTTLQGFLSPDLLSYEPLPHINPTFTSVMCGDTKNNCKAFSKCHQRSSNHNFFPHQATPKISIQPRANIPSNSTQLLSPPLQNPQTPTQFSIHARRLPPYRYHNCRLSTDTRTIRKMGL